MPIREDFARRLPKVELHAHLSGSISKTTLQKIWQTKQAAGQCVHLKDPAIALQAMPDIFTFFKVFDEYIYELVNDKQSIRTAVHSVLDDFERDGVVYLELRTTPRTIPAAGIDWRTYVEIVLQAIKDRPCPAAGPHMETHLLLSIDRKTTLEQAKSVFQLAQDFSVQSSWYLTQSDDLPRPTVLGIDLCGNPMKGDVSIFTPVFRAAKTSGLRTTVHFAEVPESSSDDELKTILSWHPDRLGHVIRVSDDIKEKIQHQDIALELCLSCNMIAKMVSGQYADHHLGYWLSTANALALSTDDVGVFQSTLSNEYLLAAEHFDLDETEVISLCHRAINAAFSSQSHLHDMLNAFATSQ